MKLYLWNIFNDSLHIPEVFMMRVKYELSNTNIHEPIMLMKNYTF